jgi:RecA/RadA recombinase
LVEQIKTRSRSGRVRRKRFSNRLIPTGIPPLDLCLSDSSSGGFLAGTVSNIVGDSHAGKTILALTCLAEVAQLSKFENYSLVLDDAERANSFDMRKLFGEKLVKRIEPPRSLDNQPCYSRTVEEFQAHMKMRLDEGNPFIYVLDSLDSISCDAEKDRIEEEVKRTLDGKEPKGTYGMEKAKKMSSLFRVLNSDIATTKSHLIVISQTRSNVNAMAFAKQRKRSGGDALDFYCHHIIWLNYMGKIPRELTRQGKKIKQIVGSNVQAVVEKNKLTGKRGIAKFKVYPSYGIDSIASSIDFLVDNGYWKGGGKKKIIAADLDLELSRSDLIEAVEENDLVEKVNSACSVCWKEVQDLFDIGRDRKSKFD